MNVPMQVVARLKPAYQPVERLKPAVAQIGLIVDTPRWRVGQQDIEITPVAGFVEQ